MDKHQLEQLRVHKTQKEAQSLYEYGYRLAGRVPRTESHSLWVPRVDFCPMPYVRSDHAVGVFVSPGGGRSTRWSLQPYLLIGSQ